MAKVKEREGRLKSLVMSDVYERKRIKESQQREKGENEGSKERKKWEEML